MKGLLGIWIGAALIAAATAVQGQIPVFEKNEVNRRDASISIADASGASRDSREALRRIDDSQNGLLWVLRVDPDHLGGPGRLIPVPTESYRQDRRQNEAHSGWIHAGDKLIVEESTPVVESRLEAVALEPTLAGSEIHVRLAMGGRIIRVKVVGPGRARMLPWESARP